MLIKDTHRPLPFADRFNIKRLLSRQHVRVLGIVVAAGLLFLGGIIFQRSGVIGRVIKPFLQKGAHPLNYVDGLMSNPQHLTIDVSYKDYQKLAHNREIAIQRDMLLPDYRDEVPADIRVGDEIVPVKLRLKGDMSDHWGHRYKWSFRIRARGENTIFRMKQFSIQHPSTRGYLNEWVFHELLRQEGLIALRYDFVEVTVNGKDQGIYALEEHFDKRLVEQNNRREGPIVRFDNYKRWTGGYLPGSIGLNEAYYQAPIDAFQSKKLHESEGYRQQFLLAKDLLESFRQGDLKVAEVFDAQKLAVLFAVTDMFGYQHATGCGNGRFYYNPVTSLLEPIGYDQGTIRDVKYSLLEGEEIELSNRLRDVFTARFFRDNEFYALYIKSLQRISEAAYLDRFFERIEPEMKEKIAILHREFPEYSFSDRWILRRNQEYISKAVNPIQGIHAYYAGVNQGKITLEVGNIHSLPIEILGLSFSENAYTPLVQQRLLPSKLLLMPPEFVSIQFSKPDGLIWSDSMIAGVRVGYRVVGTDTVKYESVFPWPYLTPEFRETDFIRQPPNVDDCPFLTVDEEAEVITIQPGSWELSHDLIIPEGYVVTCAEGTKLDLSQSAKILSYSQLYFRGSQDAPIIIASSDSGGQGIIVMNVDERSTLEWVVFDNLSNPSHARWELTGAVNFYESPVDILDCQFSGNRCEDGLNIIRSEFTIDRTAFKNTLSDAFDGDIVIGDISNTSFLNCGNDAVDISSSTVRITNVYMDGCGDKGLSIGERSHASAENVEIKNAEIAIASKDLSELSLENVTLTDCRVGFTVYKKKPEFGAASIDVTTLHLSNVEMPYVVEERSTLLIDGERIPADRKAVENILYGVEYGKSSK